MKRSIRWLTGVLTMFLAVVSQAADYSVTPLDEAPPSDEVSAEIASQLAPSGYRVMRGSSTFCDIWLLKSLAGKPDFKATPELSYPFTGGQLIGVVRYARKGADFRDQDISSGTYTARFALQPVDGAHVGTSPTRDFLLLIEASKDKSPAVLEYKTLAKQSAEAAGSSHPALLSLQAVQTDASALPAAREDEDKEWWIVEITGEKQGGGKIPLGIVMVGQAVEL